MTAVTGNKRKGSFGAPRGSTRRRTQSKRGPDAAEPSPSKIDAGPVEQDPEDDYDPYEFTVCHRSLN